MANAIQNVVFFGELSFTDSAPLINIFDTPGGVSVQSHNKGLTEPGQTLELFVNL